MYEGMFDSIGTAIAILVVFCCLVVAGLMTGGYFLFRGDGSIKSDHPRKPSIELVIKDNKVDTLYVYRKPVKDE